MFQCGWEHSSELMAKGTHYKIHRVSRLWNPRLLPGCKNSPVDRWTTHSSGLSRAPPRCLETSLRFCTYMPHFCEWPLNTYTYLRAVSLPKAERRLSAARRESGPAMWNMPSGDKDWLVWAEGSWILTLPPYTTFSAAGRVKYQHCVWQGWFCAGLRVTGCSCAN